MGLGHLSFLRDWTNPADFPTVEPDEATVRADLQYHPDAIKDYINGTLIPSHDALTDAKHSHNNKTVLDGITADDVAKWRGTIGTFRINVTYSNGVYSADKTFDEIKAAYDAGQQPYVVYGGDTIYTLSSCYFASEQMYMAFERYLIREDTLETETLRIYSYTLANGSNVEQRISAFNVPNGTTYVKVSSPGGVITTVHGETYSDIKTLINAGKPVVVRYGDALDFYYFETSEFSNSSGTHHRVSFRCDMGDSVYTLTLRDDNTWAFSETSLQTSSITDTGGYFTTDTVEGALQEIGAEMALYSGSVVIEGTVSSDMSEVTITTPDAWTLVSGAWNSEKRPLVVLRLSDDLCAYLTSVSTMTADGQSQGMALFSLPPVRQLGSTPPYSIWLDEVGGAAILPVEGINGADGEDGATFTPSVSASGTLSWTNNKGLPNPGSVNIRGPAGAAGKDGYTPVRGTDYWTADDIATIQSYIDEKATVFQSKSITDSGGYFHTDTVEGALQEIGAELAGTNTLLGSGIQISFTINIPEESEVNTFSAVSGETWTEWVGTGRPISAISGLTLYVSASGQVFADEAGMNALSLDGSTAVSGSDKIVSGATYTIISYGG